MIDLGTVAIDVLGNALKRRKCQPIDLDTGNIHLEISVSDFKRFCQAARKAFHEVRKAHEEKTPHGTGTLRECEYGNIGFGDAVEKD